MGRRDWLAVTMLVSVGMAGEARAEVPFEDQMTPGVLRGIALHEGDPWNYGYWEYLPTNFEAVDEEHRYPLLVFLGGIGQFDDPSTCPGGADVCWEAGCDAEGLCRNLRRGPMRLMWEGQWDDTARPFLFVSPQNLAPTVSTYPWDVEELDAFFDYVVENYPVDTRRMYLVGMSQGGRGVLEYTAAHPRRFTAVVTSPGGAVGGDVSCHFQDTAFWAFHGEDDADQNLGVGVFNPCWMVRRVHMYNNPGNYGDLPRCAQRTEELFPPGRITVFYDVPHTAWIPANDPLGVGFSTPSWTADEFCNVDADYRQYTANLDPDGIYSWFLDLDRPDVVAPEDLEVIHGTGSVGLTAVVEDDDAVTYEWRQMGGPTAALEGADEATVTLGDLELGQTYTFEVFVVDEDNQWDVDDVSVTVVEQAGGGSTGGDATSSTGGPADDDGGATSGSGPTTGSTMTGTGSASGETDDGAGTMTSGGTSEGFSDGFTSDEGGGDAGLDEVSGGCACAVRRERDALWSGLLLMMGLLGLRRRR